LFLPAAKAKVSSPHFPIQNAGNMDQGANQFVIENPPADGISKVTFAPEDSSLLLVSSWDKVLIHDNDRD
jgi:hypothetical protein